MIIFFGGVNPSHYTSTLNNQSGSQTKTYSNKSMLSNNESLNTRLLPIQSSLIISTWTVQSILAFRKHNHIMDISSYRNYQLYLQSYWYLTTCTFLERKMNCLKTIYNSIHIEHFCDALLYIDPNYGLFNELG